MCVCVCILYRVFDELYHICTYLQRLYLPEEDWGLQPKHVGTTKPSLQLVGDKLMYVVLLCILCGSENKQRLFPYTA
jgi:hypothetical protein